MKKQLTTALLFLFSILLFNKSFSQPMVGFNVIVPAINETETTRLGAGAEWEMYSPEIKIVKGKQTNKTKSANIPANQPKIGVRVGGDVIYANMGNKHLNDLPLVAPETGNANAYFTNSSFQTNLTSKIYFNYLHGILIPYTGAFAGGSLFASELSIHPQDNTAYTNSNISNSQTLNVGGSAGLLINVGGFFIDAGATYTHAELQQGDYLDLGSLSNQNGAADFHLGDSPTDFLTFKLGIAGYIDNSVSVRGTAGSHHCTHLSGLGHACGHLGGGISHISIHIH